MGRNEVYELEGILYDVKDAGSATIPLRKLLRLLEKGNRAAGTWKTLLDIWEEIDGQRRELQIAELPGELILLSTKKTEAVMKWAGEL